MDRDTRVDCCHRRTLSYNADTACSQVKYSGGAYENVFARPLESVSCRRSSHPARLPLRTRTLCSGVPPSCFLFNDS